MNEDFVVHRLRAKPVEYTVTISHFVRAGQWVMSVGVDGTDDDKENRLRVADDLEAAARWIREDYGDQAPDEDLGPSPLPPAVSQIVTLEPQAKLDAHGSDDV